MELKMKVIILVIMTLGVAGSVGCQALNTLAESAKNKNIAAGSDTWGGSFEGSFIGTAETAPLSFNGWFGRRRVWYASTRDDSKILPEIVKASNSSLGITAGPSGIGVSQGVAGTGEKTAATTTASP